MVKGTQLLLVATDSGTATNLPGIVVATALLFEVCVKNFGGACRNKGFANAADDVGLSDVAAKVATGIDVDLAARGILLLDGIWIPTTGILRSATRPAGMI